MTIAIRTVPLGSRGLPKILVSSSQYLLKMNKARQVKDNIMKISNRYRQLTIGHQQEMYTGIVIFSMPRIQFLMVTLAKQYIVYSLTLCQIMHYPELTFRELESMAIDVP